MTPGERAELEVVAIVEVPGAQRDAVGNGRACLHRELHLDVGRDAEVEHLAAPREPRVGPPAEIADADRRTRVDDMPGCCRGVHAAMMPGTAWVGRVRAGYDGAPISRPVGATA